MRRIKREKEMAKVEPEKLRQTKKVVRTRMRREHKGKKTLMKERQKMMQKHLFGFSVKYI